MNKIIIYVLSFACINGFAQNVGIKLTVGSIPNTALDVNGAVSYREGTALSLVNGVNSDVNLGAFTLFRVTGPTAAFNVTGFLGGVDGRILVLINTTTQTMSFSHQTTSAVANQINTGGFTISLSANGVATFIYNSTLSKWVATSVNGVTGSSTAWSLTGNSGTVDGTNFLGTTDNIPLNIRVNNQKAGRIASTGETYFGYLSGNSVTSGTYNTFIGDNTGTATTIGSQNVGVGSTALISNQGGSRNTAIGESALEDNVSGSNNVAVGRSALHDNQSGTNNTALGYESLDFNLASGNTALGYQAGSLITTGGNNIVIGVGAQVPSSTASNQLSIGNWIYGVNGNIGIGATIPTSKLEINTGSGYDGIKLKSASASVGANIYIDPAVNVTSNTPINTLWLDQLENADIAFGTNSITRFWIKANGNVGIGVNNPSHVLHISSQGRSTNSAWATTSDRRLKDIESPFEYGLKELMNINTYRFRYKKDNPLNLPTNKPFQGVIAQELEKILPEAVQNNPDGHLTVNTDPIFWTMLNSIKELKNENEALKTELELVKNTLIKQNSLNDKLVERLEKIEAFLNPNSEKTNKDLSKTEKK